jgi:O-methyltransferase
MLVKTLNKFLSKAGYQISSVNTDPVDIVSDKEFMQLYHVCKPYTMTSIERMYSLYHSVYYILKNNIYGDFVECGVWKGGSSLLISLILQREGAFDRKIYMYDTFEGMPPPSEQDKTFAGEDAKRLLDQQDKADAASIWCYSSLSDVKGTLALSAFPPSNLIFIQGKVEGTLLKDKPERISLLRLDTDWYESTKVELNILYPLLSEQGVLIIDDFGHWEGAKRAVIEYFDAADKKPLLQRIDYTGRILIKT